MHWIHLFLDSCPLEHWIPEPTALQHPAGALAARDTEAGTGVGAHHSLSLPCSEPQRGLSTQVRAPRTGRQPCPPTKPLSSRMCSCLGQGRGHTKCPVPATESHVAASRGRPAVPVTAESSWPHICVHCPVRAGLRWQCGLPRGHCLGRGPQGPDPTQTLTVPSGKQGGPPQAPSAGRKRGPRGASLSSGRRLWLRAALCSPE